MTKFPARRLIVRKILEIINPDYNDASVDDAMAIWWQNPRSTGGFGLSYAGQLAFEKAEIEYVEFDEGPSSYMGNMSFAAALNAKMVVPYYFYSNEKRKKIKIYDSRVTMLIAFYESVGAYLNTIERRN